MEERARELIAGADPARPLDLLLVNAPLRDYGVRPRLNDFTLPVLGMGYIATYAAAAGFNVGVLDAESHGLGVSATRRLINMAAPRWAGFNLLAPTYELSATIAHGLRPDIQLMVGGHHAKAMPEAVLADPRFGGRVTLIVGEAETRVAAILADSQSRKWLPGVRWAADGRIHAGTGDAAHLTPDIEAMPYLDRSFLAQDPFTADDGRVEASMVGARGCPYDCSFCGAAISANPDVTIRVRRPETLVDEMNALASRYGVSAFRFVDDLFLGHPRFIEECAASFEVESVGSRYVWDATGRINVLHRTADSVLDRLASNGCREVALGIESGSSRLLSYMGKRITPEMTIAVVRRLAERGIGIKGYFILGFPTETRSELAATVQMVHLLWNLTERLPGSFRASVFEFRPYPGTPEWARLKRKGYADNELLAYSAVDLTDQGLDEAMRGRDEFNFSVGVQFAEATVGEIRRALVALSREQYDRQE